MKIKSSIIFYLLFTLSIFAQDNSEDIYKEFDEIVGTVSNDLSQGLRFVDVYRPYSKNDYRYFKTDEFSPGYLVFKNQPYNNINIKYDILEDQIIYRNNLDKSNFELKLSSSQISTFTIHGTTFLKLPEEASQFSFYKNGFFEQLYKGQQFNLYVKYQKDKKKQLGDKTVLYKFLTTEDLVFEYNSEYYEIDSKSDIINVIAEKKAIIKAFYKKNKILKRQNLQTFMVSLFRHLDSN
jgi:hypothetical protein